MQHAGAAVRVGVAAENLERRQLAARCALLQARRKRLLSGEVRLGHVDEPLQPGLDGIELRQNLRFPVQESLLQPHRLDRLRPEERHAMGRARLGERGEGAGKLAVGQVDLVGQLAREAHPHHHRRGDADAASPRAQPRKRLARPVAAADRPHHLARFRPRQHQQGHGVGQRTNRDVLALAHALLEPVAVMRLGRRRRAVPHRAVGKDRDGGLGFEHAAAVEQVAQPDPARPPRQPPAADPVEKAERVAPRDLEAAKAARLAETDPALHRRHLRAHHVEGLGEAKARRFGEFRRRPVVVGALPAADQREIRPRRLQRRRQRRGPERPPRRAALAGQLDAELVPVLLDRLERGELDGAVGIEAARIERPGVEAGLAMDDLLREQPSQAAALADAHAQPDDAVGAAPSRHRADQRRAVGRVGDRAVDHRADLGLAQRRQAHERALEDVGDPIEIIGAQRAGEGGVDAVHPPCPACLLVESHQQPLAVLAAVEVRDGAAHQRHPPPGLGDLRDRAGQHVLVLHRHDRKLHAHHRGDFVDPVAAGVYHDLAVDVARLGVHGPAVVAALGQPGHRRLRAQLGAGAAGAACERVAQLRGVDVAVERIPQRADNALRRDQRVAPPAFLRVDHLVLHPHAARHRGEVAVGVHLRLGVGDAHAAVGVVVVDRMLGILGEVAVEADGVALQPHHRAVHAEIRHLRGGVPCGAAGQLVALEQDHVAPALLRQMVERRAAGDSPADHDAARLRFHRMSPVPAPPRHSPRRPRGQFRACAAAAPRGAGP